MSAPRTSRCFNYTLNDGDAVLMVVRDGQRYGDAAQGDAVLVTTAEAASQSRVRVGPGAEPLGALMLP